MRPVTLQLNDIKDPQVVAALAEIQRASYDTMQNDTSSSGNAMSSLVGAAANQIAYFTSQVTTAFATFTSFFLNTILSLTGIGNGLQIVSNVLSVLAGNGLNFSGSTLQANIGTPLQFVSGAIETTQQYPIDVSGGSPPSGITANALIARESAQCGYFQFVSATQCQFVPQYGDVIKINGFLYQIPSGGINFPNTNVTIDGVAGQNLAAGTNYFAYVFNNAGTLTAEFSTTGHQVDLTAGNVGNVVKSGNGTRTLVGGVLTNASAQFQDTSTQRFVASWINRKPRLITQGFGNVNNTSVNATIVQLYTGFFGFFAWGDMPVTFALEGQATNNCGLGNAGAIYFGDNVTNTGFANQFIFGTSGGAFVPYTLPFTGFFNEGGHDIFINGYANTAAGAATMTVVNSNVYGVVWG